MYRNKLSPLFLEQANDVVMDLWIGSSEVNGFGATLTSMISPTSSEAPATLTVSKMWDRWLDDPDASVGVADPDAFDWTDTPLESGGLLFGTTGKTSPAYAQGYFYQTAKPLRGVMDMGADPYHYVVTWGASGGSLNNNTSVVADKRTHFNPLVTSTTINVPPDTPAHLVAGETSTVGAVEHYLEGYVTPAIKNLQLAGKRVHIGGVYLSASGDALAAYAEQEALSWSANANLLIRAIETHLGFVGVPLVVLGITAATANTTSGADQQHNVRAQQQAFCTYREGTTLFFDTRGYPTMDAVHFDGQATMDLGADVTAARYASRMGLARITKNFTV